MAGSVRIYGTDSGYVELVSPATAGTTTLTLPTDSIQPALVKVADQSFSGASSVSINNCFSSLYDNYRIMIKSVSSISLNLDIRMRSAGVNDSSANYTRQFLAGSAGTPTSGRTTAQTAYSLETGVATSLWSIIDIYDPFSLSATLLNTISGNTQATPITVLSSGAHNVSSAFDGFSLIASTGTITGTIKVYGYRN